MVAAITAVDTSVAVTTTALHTPAVLTAAAATGVDTRVIDHIVPAHSNMVAFKRIYTHPEGKPGMWSYSTTTSPIPGAFRAVSVKGLQ